MSDACNEFIETLKEMAEWSPDVGSIQNEIYSHEDDIKKLQQAYDILMAANKFYGDPVRNEKEWLDDYEYYDPHQPLRQTSHSHGRRAREAAKQVAAIMGGEAVEYAD